MKKGTDEGIFYRNNQKSTIHCLKGHTTKRGMCTPPHFHRYCEILYGIDCDMEVWIDDVLENFKSGDICFVYSDETHYIYSEKEQNQYYVIKFSPEILSYDGMMLSEMKYLFPMLGKNGGFRHIISKSEIGEYDVEELFENAADEWEAERAGYEFAVRGDILRLFSVILREWEESSENQLPTIVNDEKAMAVYTAVAYMNEHYDDVNERQLSELLHMSYHHFSRTFKKVTGRTFSQFLTDVRLDRAKKLLLTTTDCVTDIALKTGFSSSSHMISCFKKKTGMTPKMYQKSIKK